MMGMKLSGKHSERIHDIEGEALEKLILKNVRELLIRSTELIPIVTVMEDLHWSDTTSLELLESLFRMAQTHRVVFINVFRPGYWQGDDRKIETLPEWLPEVDFAEIALKPLVNQMGETLVNNMLQVKGLRHAIRQQIIDRAGGNPFFIEEIVRSLIDEGAIVRINGAFEVTEKIDHVVIPSTINDVLMARIDRLEDLERVKTEES
jgi:predicted ATPase